MTRHICEGDLPSDGYGEAITDCREHEDGTLWAGNSEYGSQVVFCPYCGMRAKVTPSLDGYRIHPSAAPIRDGDVFHATGVPGLPDGDYVLKYAHRR